ncbi:MAG: 50S ribosomal protein L13 [bacterium]|nr:50S ribosomal protein L13 [bacterium]
MKTHIPKVDSIDRKWYILDAKDKTLGRISTGIANKLRGKDKAIFTPHMDCGDFVIVINAEKVKLTGKKLTDKMYHRHSGYPSGLKSESAKDVLEKKPTKILELAVSGMLPKNKLRKIFMKKLKLYAGEEHPHEAQNPETLEV